MPDSKPNRYRAHFLGIDEALAVELVRVLKASSCDVTQDAASADIIFCSWQQRVFQEAVTLFGHLPVVVVSRLPEVAGWIDALEAGAADYLAAPFEAVQMQWLLDNHLHGRVTLAAA